MKRLTGVLVAFAVLFPAIYVSAAPLAKDAEAAKIRREALHHEALGLEHERQSLLQHALKLSPEQPATHWALGKVRYQKQWVDVAEVPELLSTNRSLSRYFARRENYADTPDGQRELADWCKANGLKDQERAHLGRVVELSPDDAQARARLGFVRIGDQWISSDDLQAQQRDTAQAIADFRRWQPVIQELREDLGAKALPRRTGAEKRLAKITDAAAIAAIETILCPADERIAQLALNVIVAMNDERAAQSLARQAVYSAWPKIRTDSATALRDRPLEQYVPLLLNSLYTTTEARVSIFRGPGNRLIQQHVLVREGQQSREMTVMGTAYKRQAIVGANARETSDRAKQNMVQDTIELQRQVMQQNLTTAALNKRITDALTLATEQKIGEKPEDWWTWWNEYNEVYIEGQKTIAVSVISRELSIVDRPPPPPPPTSTSPYDSKYPISSRSPTSGGGTNPRNRVRPLTNAEASAINLGRGRNGFDCLAAGTPVVTALGHTAIEKIKLGDLVLSQDPLSGELTYKPVLKTTVRPEGKLVRIEIGDQQSFETSGGHLFWVAGEGWVKARNLASGMLLHTPAGAVHVSSVGPGASAKTYNLVVADFHTYFAGELQVLSHDNTVQSVQRATVPGLVAD